MPLKDIFKKKDKHPEEADTSDDGPTPSSPPHGEFTFMRTSTNMQEIIEPPVYPGDDAPEMPEKRTSRFRSSSNASASTPKSSFDGGNREKANEKRLSSRFHRHSRASSRTSINLPEGLPEPSNIAPNQDGTGEDLWERRATMLAKANPNTQDPKNEQDTVLDGVRGIQIDKTRRRSRSRSRSRSISRPEGDVG
jgi:hypothetical protein